MKLMKKADVHTLIAWFRTNKRDLPWRRNLTDYTVHVSEIMLQQTRVETVKAYFTAFVEKFPDYQSLAFAPEEAVLKAWEGLGYYSRVKNLQKAAAEITETCGGRFPEEYDRALKLKGVGEYTAGAILSRAYHLPYAAVDGNVIRVYCRLNASEENFFSESGKRTIKNELERWMQGSDPSEFNEAMMELGATVCLPAAMPKCDSCPWHESCKAHLLGKETSFPVRRSKPEKEIVEATCVYFRYRNRWLLFAKPDGVLSGLPSPYLIRRFCREDDLEYEFLQRDIAPEAVVFIKEYKHVFTHQIWYMKCFVVPISSPDGLEPTYILSMAEIEETLAVPTCFRKCFAALKQWETEYGKTPRM